MISFSPGDRTASAICADVGSGMERGHPLSAWALEAAGTSAAVIATAMPPVGGISRIIVSPPGVDPGQIPFFRG